LLAQTALSASLIHLTVPKSARLRREKPKNVILHRDDLTSSEITVQEGLPLPTIGKTVTDLLASGGRGTAVTDPQAMQDTLKASYANLQISSYIAAWFAIARLPPN
jgi:hypothetical protein